VIYDSGVIKKGIMKILIIDDEPDIRTYLMAALEDSGYETFAVKENEPAQEAIKSYQPDLIILDIMMPKQSGISIYKELRSKPQFSNIPVAIISGMLPGKDFKTEFKKLINDTTIPFPEGFIEKPFQLRTLIELVGNLLK
jgi:DNA-binding response OmpR family regulator